MDFCIISCFLLMIVVQGYSVQYADDRNGVSVLTSELKTIPDGIIINNRERDDRKISERLEDYLTNEVRGRRIKRNFQDDFINAWNAFLLWLKNSWSKIVEYFQTMKF